LVSDPAIWIIDTAVPPRLALTFRPSRAFSQSRCKRMPIIRPVPNQLLPQFLLKTPRCRHKYLLSAELQFCICSKGSVTAAMLYQPYAGIAPSRDANAYILALVPTIANGLAAITSANELFIVDRNLAAAQSRSLDNAPNGSNCLVSGDSQGQTLLCSGTNGNVATFDVRSQQEVSRFGIGRL